MRINPNVNYNILTSSPMPLTLLWFMISVTFYLKSSFFIPADLAQYIAATEPFYGNQNIAPIAGDDTLIRPGFVFIVFLLRSLTPDTLVAINIGVVALSSLLPTSIFYLGTRIANAMTGAIASTLFLAIPEMTFWVPRHLDGLWAALLIFSLAILMTWHRRSTGGLVASALTLMAILIKPAAIPGLLAPAIYRVYRRTPDTKFLLIFYFTTFTFLFITKGLWLTEVISEEYKQSDTFIFPSVLLTEVSLQNLALFTKALFEGLFAYFFSGNYGAGIFDRFPPSIVLYISILFAGIIGIKHGNFYGFLLIGLIPFSPFLAMCGIYNLRVSQFTLGFALGCLPLAAAIRGISGELLQRRLGRLTVGKAAEAVVIVALTSAVGVFMAHQSDLKFAKTFKRLAIYAALTDTQVTLEPNFYGKDLANWVEQEGANSARFIVESRSQARGLYYGTDFRIAPFFLPWEQIGDWLQISEYPDVSVFNSACKRLFLKRNSETFSPRSMLLALRPASISSLLQPNNSNYIVIRNEDDSLYAFLQNYFHLDKIKALRGSTVFRIEEIEEPEPSCLQVTHGVADFLDYIDIHFDGRYCWYVHRLSELGITFEKGFESCESFQIRR